MVLRMATVAALRDRTWAQERVYDSDNTPLLQALAKEPEARKPYIVVFTDNDNHATIEGDDVLSGDRELFLVIEIGVAHRVTVQGVTSLEIPQTDAAMEALIDMVQEQVLRALFADPRSKWGELVKSIVLRVKRAPSTRGAGAPERGTKWAARQVTLVCDTICDFPAGVPYKATHPLRRFVTMATEMGDAALKDAAKLVQGFLTPDGSAYAPWEQAQGWLGLTDAGVRAIGIAPLTDVVIGSTKYSLEGFNDVTKDGKEPPLWETTINPEDDPAGPYTATPGTDQENAAEYGAMSASEGPDVASVGGTVAP